MLFIKGTVSVISTYFFIFSFYFFLNSVALVLTISMRVFVCVSVRLCMFECVYSRPSVEVTHVIATSHWCTEPSLFRDGGVAQMVTCVLISMLGDFGTVGRGFESHRKYHIC